MILFQNRLDPKSQEEYSHSNIMLKIFGCIGIRLAILLANVLIINKNLNYFIILIAVVSLIAIIQTVLFGLYKTGIIANSNSSKTNKNLIKYSHNNNNNNNNSAQIEQSDSNYNQPQDEEQQIQNQSLFTHKNNKQQNKQNSSKKPDEISQSIQCQCQYQCQCEQVGKHKSKQLVLKQQKKQNKLNKSNSCNQKQRERYKQQRVSYRERVIPNLLWHFVMVLNGSVLIICLASISEAVLCSYIYKLRFILYFFIVESILNIAYFVVNPYLQLSQTQPWLITLKKYQLSELAYLKYIVVGFAKGSLIDYLAFGKSDIAGWTSSSGERMNLNIICFYFGISFFFVVFAIFFYQKMNIGAVVRQIIQSQ